MDEDAVSPVVGVILLIAITVVLSTVLLVTWLDGPDVRPDPQVSFKEDQGTLTVLAVRNGPIEWDDVQVTGCSVVPTGTVDGGDILSGCSGRVTLVFDNTLLLDRVV